MDLQRKNRVGDSPRSTLLRDRMSRRDALRRAALLGDFSHKGVIKRPITSDLILESVHYRKVVRADKPGDIRITPTRGDAPSMLITATTQVA